MWDYLYSADAGRAFYLIGVKPIGNRVYCLGSGTSRPLKDFIYIIRDTINPSLPLGIGSLPYERKPVSLITDISGLTADTGFKPEITFEQGIKRVVGFLKIADKV
jgi:nucleoside-diphosphate-sugar epimerase